MYPASFILMWQGSQPKTIPNRQWLDKSESKQWKTILYISNGCYYPYALMAQGLQHGCLQPQSTIEG